MTPDEAKDLIAKHLQGAKPGGYIRYENVVRLLTWCKELKTDNNNEKSMTEEEKKAISLITEKVKSPCLGLVGMRRWEPALQQATCKAFNGEYCTCHKIYEKALADELNNSKP